MKINAAGTVNANLQTTYGIGQGADSYSKNIQNQIADAQKALQELSSNENLTMEEKRQKRQEIQQEIADLNRQLRQHQIEQRKKLQTKDSSAEDLLGGGSQTQKKSADAQGISDASMQAIISADAAMGQVQVQSRVKSSLEGRAGVLKAEIKRDAGAGGNTEAKEAELAEIEEKAGNVTTSQMSALSEISKNLEEAAKEDGEADKKENAKSPSGESEENPAVHDHVDIKL